MAQDEPLDHEQVDDPARPHRGAARRHDRRGVEREAGRGEQASIVVDRVWIGVYAVSMPRLARALGAAPSEVEASGRAGDYPHLLVLLPVGDESRDGDADPLFEAGLEAVLRGCVPA